MTMIPLPSLSSDIAPIATALDALSHEERVNWMRGLGKKDLAALWALTEGRTVALSELHGPEGKVVIHEGQNSLPFFSVFQKRVMLRGGVVQGYNHQAMSWITGPGHFTVAQNERGAHFDYLQVPASSPEEFLPLAPNDKGFSRLVYANMIDYLRRVSADSVIGAAYKSGKATGDYFMLVRTP
jgi:hypothetical protein